MSCLNADAIKIIITEYMKYHNYSDKSLKKALLILNMFDRYLRETGVNDYRDVRQKDFYGFLDYKKEKSAHGVGKVTLKDYGSALKTIFTILEKEEKILTNPFGDVKAAKTLKNIRDKILTEVEISTLLNSITLDDVIGFRDRTILELLYGTGIRLSELCSLEIQDFIKDDALIFVRQGKGKKDRIIPLGKNTFDCLLKYMEKVRPKLLKRKQIKYLFFNGRFKKLDHYALEYIFKRAEKQAGINKNVRAHMIRHTYATHLLANGADIREVQLLLGHSSLKATEVYLNLTSHHLKEAYEKYHPLENELFFDVYAREAYIFKNDFPTGITLQKRKNLT